MARVLGHLARLAALSSLLLTYAPAALAADALDYSYVELAHSIDSTIETYGESYDSDSGFRFKASYLLHRHLFLAAQYHSAGYDLEGPDDYGLAGYSLGLGYRGRIGSGDAMPVDWFVLLSYEHNETQSEVSSVEYETTHSGGGLKAGLRAAVTENLELTADACEQSFGSEFLLKNGDLHGLSFELGGVLKLNDRFGVTAAYRTGELDYMFLDNFPGKYQIELDRDEVFVGVRASFR